MTRPTSRWPALVAALAGVGLVVSGTALWLSAGDGDAADVVTLDPGPALASPAPTPAEERRRTGPRAPRVGRVDATVLRPAAPVARPVGVTLPSVDRQAPVRPVGVDAEGQMELPADPAVLGWYEYGASPGRPGSTVVAGHVDDVDYGIGPLASLEDLRAGDPVRLSTTRGERDYRVIGVQRFDKQALPTELFAREGRELLRLITCGGPFDAAARSYELNIVVTAEPV